MLQMLAMVVMVLHWCKLNEDQLHSEGREFQKLRKRKVYVDHQAAMSES